MRDARGILYGEVRLMWAAFGGGRKRKDGRRDVGKRKVGREKDTSERKRAWFAAQLRSHLPWERETFVKAIRIRKIGQEIDIKNVNTMFGISTA